MSVEHIVTDQEYEVLDELYFVISFKELMRNLSFTESQLLSTLKELLQKELVKCLNPETEEEVVLTPSELEKKYVKLFFLATKKGLMEHNSREYNE